MFRLIDRNGEIMYKSANFERTCADAAELSSFDGVAFVEFRETIFTYINGNLYTRGVVCERIERSPIPAAAN